MSCLKISAVMERASKGSLQRAMAKCLSRLPITFKTSDEAQAYIRNNLEYCTDEIEKEAVSVCCAQS